NGSRRERLLHNAYYPRAPRLRDSLKPAELEPRQFDVPRAAQRAKAEVREEVVREDRLVHVEALALRLTLAVPVGKALERGRAARLRVGNRGQEEGLQDPWARRLGEVRACDEDRIG